MNRDQDATRFLPLKPLTLSVLVALEERPDYGYGIAKRVADPAGGGIHLAPSNMYYVLDRLTTSGLIEEVDVADEQDERRTHYAITPLGKAVLREEVRRLSAVLGTARRLSLVGGGHS